MRPYIALAMAVHILVFIHHTTSVQVKIFDIIDSKTTTLSTSQVKSTPMLDAVSGLSRYAHTKPWRNQKKSVVIPFLLI